MVVGSQAQDENSKAKLESALLLTIYGYIVLKSRAFNVAIGISYS